MFYRNNKPPIMGPLPSEPILKLASSASEQNTYFTYVCLINEVKPTDQNSQRSSYHFNEHRNEEEQPEEPIQVERSKALHELVENNRDYCVSTAKESCAANPTTATSEQASSDSSDHEEFLGIDNPNILKLTKMKWLSEEDRDSAASSSPSLSPASSCTSYSSEESEDNEINRYCCNEKYLSTILRLDKEHNLFGLSNIAVVGSKQSRKLRKDDDKPVFHQTAIVQICCPSKSCCRNQTRSDLPSSLKCGGCRSCSANCNPSCMSCCFSDALTCIPPASTKPCSKPSGRCCYDGCNTYGVKIKLNKKPKYVPEPYELTPRSSCVLHKPMAARTCYHTPTCTPPSPWFPYLMPCYWPGRSGAPCTNPQDCYHNPPCRPARIPQSKRLPQEKCPDHHPCEYQKSKCQNILCLGDPTRCRCSSSKYKNGKKKQKKKPKKVECECALPRCASCFVMRPLAPSIPEEEPL